MLDIERICEEYDFKELVLFTGSRGNVCASICVHNTALSNDIIEFENAWIYPPIGVGGIRRISYDSAKELIEDALKLAETMTYKIAFLSLPFGGAKMTVNIDDIPGKKIRKFIGRAIQLLGGRYFGAEDMNTDADELAAILPYTSFLLGLPKDKGGSGDPSWQTRDSVLYSLEALLEFLNLDFQEDDYSKIRFFIQGVGAVGYKILDFLAGRRAKITISDIDSRKIRYAKRQFPAIEIVPPGKEFEKEYDIFIPAAVGGIINPAAIPQFKFKGICGPANNQCFFHRECELLLKDKGIVYVPDFVANNGGIIGVVSELMPGGWQANKLWVRGLIRGNYERTKDLLLRSARENKSAMGIALDIARQNIQKAEARSSREKWARRKIIRSFNMSWV